MRCDRARKKGVASRHGYTFGTEETNFFRYLGPLGRHLAGQTFWTQINLRDIDQVPDYDLLLEKFVVSGETVAKFLFNTLTVLAI